MTEHVLECPACGATGTLETHGACACGSPDCHGGDIKKHSRGVYLLQIEGRSMPMCKKCGCGMEEVERA